MKPVFFVGFVSLIFSGCTMCSKCDAVGTDRFFFFRFGTWLITRNNTVQHSKMTAGLKRTAEMHCNRWMRVMCGVGNGLRYATFSPQCRTKYGFISYCEPAIKFEYYFYWIRVKTITICTLKMEHVNWGCSHIDEYVSECMSVYAWDDLHVCGM